MILILKIYLKTSNSAVQFRWKKAEPGINLYKATKYIFRYILDSSQIYSESQRIQIHQFAPFSIFCMEYSLPRIFCNSEYIGLRGSGMETKAAQSVIFSKISKFDDTQNNLVELFSSTVCSQLYLQTFLDERLHVSMFRFPHLVYLIRQ